MTDPDERDEDLDNAGGHAPDDECGTHFWVAPYLACGESFMAGSICTLPAGHDYPGHLNF